MRRRALCGLIAIPVIGATILATSSWNGADALRGVFPELEPVAHRRVGESEAWLYTGRASVDEIVRKVQTAHEGRPGWTDFDPDPDRGVVYAAHYSPSMDPRLLDHLPLLHLLDWRAVLDVQVKVGRATHGDERLRHGSGWTTVHIQATPIGAEEAGAVFNDPLQDWTVLGTNR